MNSAKKERPQWASYVRSVLYDQGRNQVWLARKLGMDSTQLRHILNGSMRYRVTPSLVSTIAALLGIPHEDIPADFHPVEAQDSTGSE